MKTPKFSVAGLLALALSVNATYSVQATDGPDATRPPKGKWEKIFDGKSFTGWHNYNKAGQPISDQWKIEDGAMTLAGKGGGDIISDKEYENFELELEWKIASGGNSGIFYHVVEDPKFKTPYMTGPEVQVLDNERHPDAKQGRNNNRTAGSLYDMLPPSDPSAYKPAGEWNKIRIMVSNGKAEHYLNGKKIVEYPTTGPEWEKMVSESKFKGWEGFGKYSKGHIGLQDHGDQVWFRNIQIREL